jgi:tetratricopeptide (TPR) repeat protein
MGLTGLSSIRLTSRGKPVASEKINVLDGIDPFILAARGEAKLQTAYLKDGLNEMETALASEPDQPDIQNAIAWFYLNGPIDARDFARALAHALRAVRLNPERSYYHNTLGVCLARLGRYREAIPELEASLNRARATESLYDLYTLALCHHRLNETTRAKAIYGRARQIHLSSHLTGTISVELEEFRAMAASLIEPQPATGIPR